MTPAEIREEILDILADIAPDDDLSDLKDELPFRQQLELDSMDFLDIVMELRKRHRVAIPQSGPDGAGQRSLSPAGTSLSHVSGQGALSDLSERVAGSDSGA